MRAKKSISVSIATIVIFGTICAYAVAASLFTTIFTIDPKSLNAYGQVQSDNSSFVLYYGVMDSSSLVSILKTHPTFVVMNMSDDTTIDPLPILHENGIKAIGAFGINYEKVSLDTALGKADEFLKKGADGIFIDESPPQGSAYLASLYKEIKSHGNDKIVICNPGMIYIKESLMSSCDILSLEHEWRSADSIPWFHKYPSSRYMGFNSDFGSRVGGATGDAQKNLMDAHTIGVQYQYTSHDFISIPPWIRIYNDGNGVGLANNNQRQMRTVDVQFNAVSQNITGSEVVVKIYATNTTLYAGEKPAIVKVPVDTVIEATWTAPPGQSYAGASIPGAIETFSVSYGDPAWRGVQRFHIPANSNADSYIDTAIYR